MKLQKVPAAIFDSIIGMLAFLAGILLSFMMLGVSADVSMRYLLNRPIPWMLEVTEYCLLFITFLGAAWVLKRERHVTIDLVLNRLNPRTQATFNIITSVIGAIVCLVVAWYGAQATWDYFLTGLYRLTFLRPPSALIMAIVPIGSFLLFIQFLRRTHGYLGSWRGLRHKKQSS